MGIVGGGAFAELITVHEREALAIPERLDFPRAAAIPEVFLTAFDALALQGQLRPSEVALIHAATSGVGTAAVQIARQFGATVVGTSRSEEKLARCVPLGLTHGVVVVGGGEPAFAQKVQELAGRGADVALELVGGAYLAETLNAMAMHGRLLQVGMLAGGRASVDLRILMHKRVRLVGTVLRARPLEEKISLARAFEAQVSPLLAAEKIRPVLDQALPFEAVQEALGQMETGEAFGKQVLVWR
jgi:NADPH:quinone reductase-like Zn-dependent oxidoreductase